MLQPSRRTLWTGSSVMLAAAAFVSTLVLVEESAKDKLDGAQPFLAFQAAIDSLVKTEVALKN